MLLGSALLGGLGQAIVLVPAGLVIAWFKVRAEERLLLATFPDEYAAYGQQVPALILVGAPACLTHRSPAGPSMESDEEGWWIVAMTAQGIQARSVGQANVQPDDIDLLRTIPCGVAQ